MAVFANIYEKVAGEIIDTSAEIQNRIPGWINQAFRDAEKKPGINLRHMERLTFIDTVAAQRALASGKPSDWKEKRDEPWRLYANGDTGGLEWAPSEAEMRARYPYSNTARTGAPVYILETPDGFEVYPFSDGQGDFGGQYRIAIPYYGMTPLLVGDGETNWWTENAEEFLKHQAAGYGLLFADWPDRAAAQFAQAKTLLDDIIRHDKRSKLARRVTIEPKSGPHVTPRRTRL
jgi:hypothetical protein